MAAEPSSPSMIKRAARLLLRITLTLAVIAGAAAGVYVGQGYFQARADAVPAPEAAPLTRVAVTALTPSDGFAQTRSFVGQVEPARTVQTSFELPGQLATITVDEGDIVRAGDTLATQNTDLILAEQAQLVSSRDAIAAQLDFASQRLDRATALLDRGFASQEQLDQAIAAEDELTARIRELNAALGTIDIRLSKSTLTAPFDGRITRRFVDGGEAMNPGQPVLEIVQTSAPLIRVGLPLSLDPASLQTAQIALAGAQIPAEFITLRPDIDPITRTRTALYRPTAPLNAAFGQTVEVAINTQVTADGTWVPLDSLKEGERGQWTLLVLDDSDIVRRANAVVVHADDARVFVRGSFPPGTRIVDAGTQRVVPGQRVLPMPVQEG
ncbi:MAG: efflux RND transporter periplasmic adaptor subunit [Pseudomonadota bacterium]